MPLLRLLHLEDSDDDSILLQRILNSNLQLLEYKRVDSLHEFENAIKTGKFDIILSDYKLSGFYGTEALSKLKEINQDIPFIFLSGVIGEDIAVEAMKKGANDYVMKSNMKRLIPAINREIHETQIRKNSELLSEIQFYLSSLFANSYSILEASQKMLALFGQKLNFNSSTLWVYKNNYKKIEYITSWNKNGTSNNKSNDDTSLALKTCDEKKLIWIESYNNSGNNGLEENYLKFWVTCPVMHETQVLAVIGCYGRQHNYSKEIIEKVLHSGANQFAQFMKRKDMENQISYMGQHDLLTGLPNRILIHSTLEDNINFLTPKKRRLAVLTINLNNFKSIISAIGHEGGDQILKQVSIRLRQIVRLRDIVGRSSGDEFILIMNNIKNHFRIFHASRRIQKIFHDPFIVNNKEYYITTSIGITLFPQDGTDADSLLKNSSIALNKAKEIGGNELQFFSSEMLTLASKRLAIENGIRKALEQNELILYYQPKYDLVKKKIIGMEGLIRWRQAGKISLPEEFVQIAEESELINSIGKWVFKTAAEQLSEWKKMNHLNHFTLSINISARQFKQKTFLEDIKKIISDFKIEPNWLEFEITESVLMENAENAMKTINALKKLGIRISIDDFGTGYSSLNYLVSFNPDSIKIDKSFMKDIQGDRNKASVVKAILAMAKGLNIQAVAEGVETEEQMKFLRKNECDIIQGFYFSEPLPVDKANILLQKYK